MYDDDDDDDGVTESSRMDDVIRQWLDRRKVSSSADGWHDPNQHLLIFNIPNYCDVIPDMYDKINSRIDPAKVLLGLQAACS